MLKFVLVEDEAPAVERLKKYILKYCGEAGEEAEVTVFEDAQSFLKGYKPGFDAVFMDIAMPGMNGMDAARRLRENDKTVVLVFVTTLTQYAIKGYEVDALDYMVKPIAYQDFAMRFRRVLERAASHKGHDIRIRIANGFYTTASSRLMYVEITSHDLVYHLTDDTITAKGSLKEVEEQLTPMGFLRCNACYLVNPMHITRVQNLSVIVGKDELKISRGRKQAFLEELTKWYGEHG